MMDLALAVNIFCNGEYFVRQRREMAAESGVSANREADKHGNNERAAADQQRKPQGGEMPLVQGFARRPWLAPEFDGLHFFETFVFH